MGVPCNLYDSAGDYRPVSNRQIHLVMSYCADLIAAPMRILPE